MVFIKTKVITSSLVLLASLLVPLITLVPQVSAAADTCTWTGGGTGTEDMGAKTWTFDVSDSANWSGCDNGMVPEAGDSLVFPANLAVVDPDNSETDDYAWKYIINNNLAIDTNIAGLLFNGDTGTDCEVYDDRYTVAGNSISLSGNVAVTTTGSCATSRTSELDMSIDVTADVFIAININDSVLPTGVNVIDYGSNAIGFCDFADGSRLSKYLYPNNTQLTGTGTLTVACGSFSLNSDDSNTFGDVTVEPDSNIGGLQQVWGYSATNTFTFKDNATFSFSDYSTAAALEFASDIVFEGTGAEQPYCISTTCTGAGQVMIDNHRGFVSNVSGGYSMPQLYHNTVFSGDITMAGDSSLNLGSNVEFTGLITGGSFKLRPGNRGELKTAGGTLKPTKINFALTDTAYDQYVSYGNVATLSSDNPIDDKITVYEGGRLKGKGSVAGIEIEAGGTLAPGDSPGCIISTSGLTLAGTFEVEIAGTTACTGYDQTDVTGAVNVTGGTLDVLAFLDGFVPALDDKFVIINNDAADTVTGTFTGLAEGATLSVGGATLAVSYVGGDGNDVVLTATAVPAAADTPGTPDTGIGSLVSNPFVPFLSAMLSLGAVIGVRKINNVSK